MPSCLFPLYPFRVDLQYVDVYNPSKVRINYIPLRLIKIDPSLIQAHLRIIHYLALGQNPGALHWTSKKLGSNLVGGIPDPLKNMKVSWDYYSQYMGKKVPNHQPVIIDAHSPGNYGTTHPSPRTTPIPTFFGLNPCNQLVPYLSLYITPSSPKKR